MAQWVKNHMKCRSTRRHRFDLWVRRVPWGREWYPTPLFLPEKSHEWRILVGYSPKGHKELDRTG